MNSVVFDASAALAWLQKEAGSEMLTVELLAVSRISTVNLAEVQTKLVRGGGDAQAAWFDAQAVFSEIEPFTAEQARIAGSLVSQTRPLGLSLGDRACLALAITLKAPVYTTDWLWKDLQIGVAIHVLR